MKQDVRTQILGFALAFTAAASEAQIVVSNPNNFALVVTEVGGSELVRIPNYGKVSSYAHAGNLLFVVDLGFRFLDRIDLSTGRVLDPIPLVGWPSALAMSADGKLLFLGENWDSVAKVVVLRAVAEEEYITGFDVKGTRVARIMNRGDDMVVTSFGGPLLPPTHFSVAIIRDLKVVREFEVEGNPDSFLLIGAQETNTDPPCHGDHDHSGDVTVDEILQSVDNALNGCPLPPP